MGSIRPHSRMARLSAADRDTADKVLVNEGEPRPAELPAAPGPLAFAHPALAVRDVAQMRARFGALGFRMTPISFQQFGACTTQAVFRNCMIEVLGVYDEAKLDDVPAGGFRMGRWLKSAIDERDGVAFIVLYSADAHRDAARLADRGLTIQGRMEYGRYAMLPGMKPARTRTTSFVAHDPAFPRLTTLICQQHRRDVLEPERFLQHPNTASGVCQITILAARTTHPMLEAHYATIYGPDAVARRSGGFGVRTGSGMIVVMDQPSVEFAYGAVPPALTAETRPVCIATHVQVQSSQAVLPFVRRSGFAHEAIGGRVVVQDAEAFGNTYLVFEGRSPD